MANEVAPLFRPGHQISVVADGADITGGTFVTVSDGRGADGVIKVAKANAGGAAFGVAASDIKKDGIGSVIREGVVPVAATGQISAGGLVEVGSDGTAVANSSGVAVGMAVDDAADGVVFVALSL
ncbi:MAG TPA: capsid cement protein [Methylophilaceae bacterium]